MDLERGRQGEVAKKGQKEGVMGKGRRAGQGVAPAYYPAFVLEQNLSPGSPKKSWVLSSWMQSGPETASAPAATFNH